MKYRYLVFIVASLMLMASCMEKEIVPITASQGKPGIPTNIQIEAIPGGANISYSIPDTEDLLAVKCVYTLSNGTQYETMTSFYDNKLRIEGFFDENEHEVSLYAVNRAQELSDPVVLKFRPLESPISKAIKSATIARDFGGAQYTWENPDKANLSISFITPDTTGLMQIMRIVSTNGKNGTYSLRGYKSVPRVFAMLIRDQYGNVSDSIFPINAETGERELLTPIYEKKLDKKKIVIMALDNDCAWNAFDTAERDMFDDDHNSISHSPQNAIPAYLSLDLGVEAKLSRVVVHQRRYDGHFYNWGNPVTFNVYGIDHEPSRSGNWDEWNLLMNCEIIKPSGLPINQESDEDIAVAEGGHDFPFGLDIQPLRYIRFSFTKTWSAIPTVHIAEITIYGDDGNPEEE